MIDQAKIYIKAGNGGDGCVSFHREKYVAAGGPDGGDGGHGGSIYFEVDDNLSTLADFRYRRKYQAQNGENGKGANRFGKAGENLVLRVPKGTVVKDLETGYVLADIIEKGKRYLVAKGGNGGWGNQHFATSTRQAPKFAKNGTPGQEREVILELKLIADVGLLGFPNVGKSTFLSRVTKARPKIANYHFTTLEPNLGVVELSDNRSFVLADIPGIIEGAHAGVGLGHEFLRHIERTRLFIHVVDVSGIEGRNPIEDFLTINEELMRYNPKLKEKQQIVVANKIDILQDEALYQQFQTSISQMGFEVYGISAATGKGVQAVIDRAYTLLQSLPTPALLEEYMPEGFLEETPEEKLFTITKEINVYLVEGKWIQKILGSVNFDDYESLQYFQRQLQKNGVINELEAMGIQEGDLVKLYDLEFDFVR